MAKGNKCNVCVRTFASKKELDQHTQKAHPPKKEEKKAAQPKTA